MQGHTQLVAERLQPRCISLIVDIFHPHVECLYADGWLVDAGLCCQQLQQTERVLATRKTHENLVAILSQSVLHESCTETSSDAFLQCHYILPWSPR